MCPLSRSCCWEAVRLTRACWRQLWSDQVRPLAGPSGRETSGSRRHFCWKAMCSHSTALQRPGGPVVETTSDGPPTRADVPEDATR